MDVLTTEQRKRNMRRIRSRDTRPEFTIRRELHARGFRYRLHKRTLPGTPDLVFWKYNSVIFINGCFWHGHDCSLFNWPKTRTSFWKKKIKDTKARDLRNYELLRKSGWRVLIIWECATRGRGRLDLSEIAVRTIDFLTAENTNISEIRGQLSNHIISSDDRSN